jgi:thymidine kinase
MYNPIAPRLVVIAGGMASGKSAELIRLAEREALGGRRVLRLAPTISRTRGEEIRSRTGRFAGSVPLESPAALAGLVSDHHPDVVAIDEAQFIGEGLASAIEALLHGGRPLKVIVALLDLDFAARPFPGAGELLALADEVVKLTAICVRCGEEASRSQRLVDGAPAPRDTPLLAIESGAISYEARCRSCYEAPGA